MFCRKSYISRTSASGPRGDYGDSLGCVSVYHRGLHDGEQEIGRMWEFRSKTRERASERRRIKPGSRTGRTARACPKTTEHERRKPMRLVRVPRDIQWFQYQATAGQNSMWLHRGEDSLSCAWQRYATWTSDPWIKIGAKARGVIAHVSLGRPPLRSAPQVPIDDSEVTIRERHGDTIAFFVCLSAISLKLTRAYFASHCLTFPLFLFMPLLKIYLDFWVYIWLSCECVRNAHALAVRSRSKCEKIEAFDRHCVQINTTIRILL